MTTEADYSYEYEYDVAYGNSSPDVTRYAILGIALTLGIVTSIMLMPWPLILRRQKSTPFFIILTSWSLANLFYLVVSATTDISPGYSWTYGEFWCRGVHYLTKSISFTRAYLMVLAALLTLLGNYRFGQCTGPRACVRIVTALLASSLVWILVFLPCIQYWFQPEFKTVGVARQAWWCLRSQGMALLMMELVLLYVVPSVVTGGALLAWACRKPKPKMADRKERIQAIVLMIILHVFVVANFLERFVVPFVFDDGAQTYGYYRALILARLIFRWLDHVMSPTLSLVAILVYRRQLTGSEKQERSHDDMEET